MICLEIRYNRTLSLIHISLAGGLLGGLVIETWGLGYMACIGGMIVLDVLALAALIALLLRRPDDTCEKRKGMVG